MPPFQLSVHPNRPRVRHRRCLIAALLLSSCAPPRDGCEPLEESVALHDDVSEASGIAGSRAHDDVLWVHNDSDGGAWIFAIHSNGEALGRVDLNGAHNRDWEDISVGRCPDGGPDGDCIYVADIGDNRATREGVGLWVAAEPDPDTRNAVDAVFYRVRYPDGPRDAEALAVLDDGSVLIISKGREQPVSVYRSTPLAWPDGASEAEADLLLVQRLTAAPVDLPDQITGGAASADGRTVALRSYAHLQFYRLAGDTLEPILAEPFRLDSLGEPQGEGVSMGRRGRVYLVSEAGPQGIAPRLTPLRCRLP